MNAERKKMPFYKGLALTIFAISYAIFASLISSIGNQDDVSSSTVFFCSWLGIALFLSYIIWWKRLTGKYLTPFTIFLIFVTLFNFGQCFLWAFGIHSDSEIGRRLVFNSVSANNALILKAQLLYMISYIAINTGGLLLYKKTDRNEKISLPKENDSKYRTLFIASALASAYSIPVTLYVAVQKLRFTQIYSYHDMYYGSISSAFDGPLFVIGCSLFTISLIGLLIGSRYKKKVMIFVYSVFSLYAIITLLGGDRGEWIMPFIFLFWMHISFYKPLRKKQILILVVIAFLSLYVMNAIVSLRNTGLSYDGFTNALVDNDGVLRPLLTEFGNTMGISIILMSKGTVSPYGNTYLMSIPTMFGTGIANSLFGMNYVQLHTWFPLEYLKINYGTDFSIIGEAILNYGVMLAPVVLFIGGLIFGKIFNYPFKDEKSTLALCLSFNAMIYIIGIARSTLWITLNRIVMSTMLFVLVYFVIKVLISFQGSKIITNGESEKINE